nr:MATE family efflux transporter [uncultured Ruminococcus sp.]
MQENHSATQTGTPNKLADFPIRTLILSMGMPMVLSMVLQAVYNIVDTVFVSHMKNGATAVLALTDSYSIQLLIVAVGVGTGIGINALLSKTLGERNSEKAACIAGNGIFLAICIYAVFLLFGIFGTKPFIAMQANGNALRQEMGEQYLRICCMGSFGSIGYTVYERFLQGTGRTNLSTIAQITGAALNILLDPLFIFGLDMGVVGAAVATVVGQVASLVMAMLFHYRWDREIRQDWKRIRPRWGLIRGIYAIGIPAAVMQGLLSVMVLFVNLVFGTQGDLAEPLQAAYGIYYKIQQFALFAAFGLSNTLITVVAFHYGRREKARLRQCVRYGLAVRRRTDAYSDSFISAVCSTDLRFVSERRQQGSAAALHAVYAYLYAGLCVYGNHCADTGHLAGLSLCVFAAAAGTASPACAADSVLSAVSDV